MDTFLYLGEKMEYSKLNFKSDRSPVINKQNENNVDKKPENHFKKNIFETSDKKRISFVDSMSEKEIAEMNLVLDTSRNEYEEYGKSDLDSAIEKINKKTTGEGTTTLIAIKNYTEKNYRMFFDDIARFYPSEKDKIFADIIKKIDKPKDMTTKNAINPGIAFKILALCLENQSDASLEFVEKFIDNCSKESLNAILKKDNLNEYANIYIPESSLAKKITEKYLDIRGKLNDGKIEDSSQGEIGDCWLLSGINAMRYSKKGQEIINKQITETENGYNVRFEGLDKDIEITKQEIAEAILSYEYSKGDTDVLLYELAFEKGLSEVENKTDSTTEKSNGQNDEHAAIDGGSMMLFISALTGKKTKNIANNKGYNDETYHSQAPISKFFKKYTNKLIERLEYALDLNPTLNKIENSDDIVASVYFMSKNNNEKRYLTDIEGNKHIVAGSKTDPDHACAIKSVDGDLVTVVNPWDSSEDIVITKEELLDNTYMISYCDLSED